MEYPFHVHDVQISDPCILADPVTGKYYLYAAFFNPDRFPDQKRRGVFHALVSEDLVHWSEPVQVFDAAETGFWADRTTGPRSATSGRGGTTSSPPSARRASSAVASAW